MTNAARSSRENFSFFQRGLWAKIVNLHKTPPVIRPKMPGRRTEKAYPSTARRLT
jgi:hypothetical protein